jgi:hypothetical protein
MDSGFHRSDDFYKTILIENFYKKSIRLLRQVFWLSRLFSGLPIPVLRNSGIETFAKRPLLPNFGVRLKF